VLHRSRRLGHGGECVKVALQPRIVHPQNKRTLPATSPASRFARAGSAPTGNPHGARVVVSALDRL
jgi:hypothetical protein